MSADLPSPESSAGAPGSENQPAVCPHCGKSVAYTWTRDWSSDGRTEYLGHVCQSTRGGCGKHFDTERAAASPNESSSAAELGGKGQP
jgi:hypothetical protein